jgi:hypothetical protein
VQGVSLFLPGFTDLLFLALDLGPASGGDHFPLLGEFLRVAGQRGFRLGAGDRLGALVHDQQQQNQRPHGAQQHREERKSGNL